MDCKRLAAVVFNHRTRHWIEDEALEMPFVVEHKISNDPSNATSRRPPLRSDSEDLALTEGRSPDRRAEGFVDVVEIPVVLDEPRYRRYRPGRITVDVVPPLFMAIPMLSTGAWTEAAAAGLNGVRLRRIAVPLAALIASKIPVEDGLPNRFRLRDSVPTIRTGPAGG